MSAGIEQGESSHHSTFHLFMTIQLGTELRVTPLNFFLFQHVWFLTRMSADGLELLLSLCKKVVSK